MQVEYLVVNMKSGSHGSPLSEVDKLPLSFAIVWDAHKQKKMQKKPKKAKYRKRVQTKVAKKTKNAEAVSTVLQMIVLLIITLRLFCTQFYYTLTDRLRSRGQCRHRS